MINAQNLADRYVAVWNETDLQLRREMIAELWNADGVHFVRTLEARGYDALEARIVGSHNKNVRDGGYSFQASPNAEQLRDIVKFNWTMAPARGGPTAAIGLDVLVLDDNGRIREDYQFIEPTP
jgi:hypothetical protein